MIAIGSSLLALNVDRRQQDRNLLQTVDHTGQPGIRLSSRHGQKQLKEMPTRQFAVHQISHPLSSISIDTRRRSSELTVVLPSQASH